MDASVAVKWIVREHGSESAELLLQRGDLLAPDLIFVEVANALRRKVALGELQQSKVSDGLRLIHDAVTATRTGLVLTKRASAIAHQMQHPVYDCIYMALAERRGTQFVTLDQQLRRRIERHGFGQLLSEMPVTEQSS